MGKQIGPFLEQLSVSGLHKSLLENTVFAEILGVLLKVVDVRDRYVKEHSVRVMHYGVELAKRLDLPAEVMEEIRIGSLLHDLGKIGISELIMNKAGRLTTNEFEKIKEHPVIGYQIIEDIEGFEISKDVILHHHERWDGKGYPLGLAGEEIPLAARIICIADAFDAMTSVRVYRRSTFTWGEALAEIERCSGQQFDPELSQIFVKMMNNSEHSQWEIA